jgi:CHAT domain-containing protein
LAEYRGVPWLAKRHGVTILPSVGSLKAARVSGRAHAPKAMFGFGDPVFGGPDDQRVVPSQRGTGAPARTRNPAYTDFWKGAGVDRTALSQGLPRLPDTADELKAVAAKLQDPSSVVLLGIDATETAVKRSALIDYRIIYFSTHGLVAGDVKGIGEPSLALSLPSQSTSLDDGLLTSSEVAQLSLNADWVVLSACNTISGDKPGAEALSGLSRAFFYAGARSLLVSHWSVASDAATVLAISTFDALAKDPKLGKAEALRRAMVVYMDNPSDIWNAYPAMWGPFVVVGDNANP